MSLHLNPKMSRLTVLGSGWSNTSFESGPGFTPEGDLWQEIAEILDFDFGEDVDWDLIAESEWPEFPWQDIVFTDPEFPDITYTDPDGDGIWTDPLTGFEYPGGGTMWVPQPILTRVADALDDIATGDAGLSRYNIPRDRLSSIYGGKVSTEINCLYPESSDRPHTYTPAVWYIQDGNSNGIIFLGEPFFHGTADGGSITVYDEAITIRDGSSKAVYWSNCTTQFSGNTLPSEYRSIPIQYVCWQCLYGPLDDALIKKTEDTKTSDDIRGGTSGIPTMIYGGGKYYAMTK